MLHVLCIIYVFEQQAQHTKYIYSNFNWQYQVIESTYEHLLDISVLITTNLYRYDKVTSSEMFCLYALSNTPSSPLGFTKHTWIF